MEELKAREHEQVRPWSSAGKAQHQRWFRGVCGGGGGNDSSVLQAIGPASELGK